MNTNTYAVIGFALSIFMGIALGMIVWGNSIYNDFRTLESSILNAWTHTESSVKHLATSFPTLSAQIPPNQEQLYLQNFQQLYTKATSSSDISLMTIEERIQSAKKYQSFMEALAMGSNVDGAVQYAHAGSDPYATGFNAQGAGFNAQGAGFNAYGAAPTEFKKLNRQLNEEMTALFQHIDLYNHHIQTFPKQLIAPLFNFSAITYDDQLNTKETIE